MSSTFRRPMGRACVCLLAVAAMTALSPAMADDRNSDQERPETANPDKSMRSVATERSPDDETAAGGADDGEGRQPTDEESSQTAASADGEEKPDAQVESKPAESSDSEANSGQPVTSAPAKSDAATPSPSQKTEADPAPIAPQMPMPTPVKAEPPAVVPPASPASTPSAAPSTTANAKTAPRVGAPPAVGKGHVEPSTPTENDVFNTHAEQILKSEISPSLSKVHPLALKYPGHDVVVCTAGCGPGGRVVHMARKREQAPVTQAEMIPTSAQAGSAQPGGDNGLVSCLAGCYTTARSYRGVERRADLVPNPALKAAGPGAAAALPLPVAAAGTAVSPAATADALGGKWTATVIPGSGAGDAAPGAGQPVMQKPREQTNESGDWMQKINSDRSSGPVAE